MTLSGGSERASDMSGQTVLTAEDVDIDVVGEGDEEGMERVDSDCDSPGTGILHDLRGEVGDDDVEDEIEVEKEEDEMRSGGGSPCCESSGEGEAGTGKGEGHDGSAASGGAMKDQTALMMQSFGAYSLGGPYGRHYGIHPAAYSHPAALQYPYIPPVGHMLPPGVPLLPSAELNRKAFNTQLSPSLQLQLNSLSTASMIKSEPSNRPSFSIENIIGVSSASSSSPQAFLRPPVTVQSALLSAQSLSLTRTSAAIAPILSVPSNLISGHVLPSATAAAVSKWSSQ
ncbi:forkhead box protein D3 [Solea senegalensis]|uniref:Forkhead box protein D3 n=1 Tax=Solea senegalensis TaxID=28829 RepID=A0AAV6SAV1_SOLSE|nr:forkhead box protein D3 [Solea senegalensis]